MAGTWTSTTFPRFDAQVRDLTKQHRELEDEPLHLAICYSPKRDRQDIFLLEAIGGNCGDSISSDQELFETTFASSPSFPMAAGQQLHLILTNRPELEVALSEGWPSVLEVVDAIQSNDYQKLYSDETGDQILKHLTEAGRMEGAARG